MVSVIILFYFVQILLQENNLGIKYQYNVPINAVGNNGTEFVWQFKPWTDCSATCARGVVLLLFIYVMVVMVVV